MKVGLYVNSFLPAVGGREVVVHYIATNLLKMGHNPRVFAPGRHFHRRNLKMNYPIICWPKFKGRLGEKIEEAFLYLNTVLWGIDVIHSHSTYPSGYNVAISSSLRNIPLVITPHGEDVHKVPDIKFGLRMDPELDKKIRFAMERADIVTAISNDVAMSCIDAGADINKIKRIANGVDIDRFHNVNDRTECRSLLGIPPHSHVMLAVGSYHIKRGYEILLDAMASISRSNLNLVLLIVGRGCEALRQSIKKKDLEQSVWLMGQLPPYVMSRNQPDKLTCCYIAADLFISSGMTSGAEGLSLALLDAMAAGLPIVATNISGSADVVKDGENGFLVEPGNSEAIGDRILSILNDDKLREMMKASSSQLSKNFAWDNILREYLDAYREAIIRRKQDSIS